LARRDRDSFLFGMNLALGTPPRIMLMPGAE
jgi:hypothetical protein